MPQNTNLSIYHIPITSPIRGSKEGVDSDHLGSSSFITDINGNATQHLQYLPFGELFIEQRSDAHYYTPYKFSAKEKDEETGYSYFGARYLNTDFSIWLSVDPMSDKYPHQSGYSYCGWRPINVIDPNGLDENPIIDVSGNLLGKDENGWSGTVIVMNKNDFKEGMNHKEAESKGVYLDQYSKGIKISESTWKSIEDNSGQRMKPFVENNTSQTIYYKPEKETKYVENDGAYPIGPKEDLYSPVDGVNSTLIKPQKVYKLPTSYRVIVNPDGLDIINFLEKATPYIPIIPTYGEVDAPDKSWNKLRDCFNNLPSRR